MLKISKKALNDQTWAEIRQVSDAGQGSSYWSVGDRKAVLMLQDTVLAVVEPSDHI